MTGAVTWGLVISSLAVIVVRRRSVAILLVAAQSLGLGLYALTQGSHTSTALAVAGTVLIAKALVLPALLLFTVRRARKERLIATEIPGVGAPGDRGRGGARDRGADSALRPDRARVWSTPRSACWRSAS